MCIYNATDWMLVTMYCITALLILMIFGTDEHSPEEHMVWFASFYVIPRGQSRRIVRYKTKNLLKNYTFHFI